MIGTCWELNCEKIRNAGHFGSGLICLGLFHPNLGGGGVVSDLVGVSFRPIFRVSHFGLWLFWPRLKVIMYALLYVYEWTDGQVLSFVKQANSENLCPPPLLFITQGTHYLFTLIVKTLKND